MAKKNIGEKLYKWAEDLFPFNRSLSGEGVRQTLSYLKEILPDIQIKSFKSGEKAFDWTIPKEWKVNKAFIKDSMGNIIVNFESNNLHLVGYSTSVDKKISYNKLIKKIHFIEKQPDAIPYVTSYYNEDWGFCLSYNDFLKLDKKETYHVHIDSILFDGVLNYGEILIPGKSKKEVILSTYICHPSMANNELSGPVVTTALVQWILKRSRRYTYRILFLPETIGSIAYLSLNNNYKKLKANVVAGFQITCIGDPNGCSFLTSRLENTYADKIVSFYLEDKKIDHIKYPYTKRGSDERQWCSPGIDLPFVSLMNSKHGNYKEYHTSLDNMSFINSIGLDFGYKNIRNCIKILEKDKYYYTTILCEPQLGKRGLYINNKNTVTREDSNKIRDILAYCDGNHSLIDICKIVEIEFQECNKFISKLLENNIIKEKKSDSL